MALQKALELMTKATLEDDAIHLEAAVELYEQAIVQFKRAMKYESKNEHQEETIRWKMITCMDRSDKTKAYLAGPEKQIQRAMDLITRAMQEDNAGYLYAAYNLYRRGIDHLKPAIKYGPQDDKLTEKIRSKMMIYIERAEEIKILLDHKPIDNDSDLETEKDDGVGNNDGGNTLKLWCFC